MSKYPEIKWRFELAGGVIPTDNQIAEIIEIQAKYDAAGIYGNVDIVDFIIRIQNENEG